MRALAIDSRFGIQVISSEATGTIPFQPVRASLPMTLYVVTATGAVGDRVVLRDSSVTTDWFSAGRNSSGVQWFAQAFDSASRVAGVSEAAGPTVLCATRTETRVSVRALSGATASQGATGWSPTSTLTRAVVNASILHWELWAGKAHSDHVAASLSSKMAARFL